jgi:hypothetical protein
VKSPRKELSRPTTLRFTTDTIEAIKFIAKASVAAKSTVSVIRGALAKYKELLAWQVRASLLEGQLVVTYRGKQELEGWSDTVLDLRL